MKYLYNRGTGKQSSRKWLVVPAFLLALGLYLGFNLLSPLIFSVAEPRDRTANLLKTQQPQQDVDRLYIPKINANITIAPIGTDETEALNIGVASRSNQNGNPKAGGNYVLAAERFSLQLLPYDTFKKSPFYNLKNLQVGDDLFVDYKGTRFSYKIDARLEKASTDPSIEASSEEAKLTLFTIELTSDDKREIITARQVGKVVWAAGIPKVQPVTD
jgi:sortase A